MIIEKERNRGDWMMLEKEGRQREKKRWHLRRTKEEKLIRRDNGLREGAEKRRVKGNEK